MQPPPLTSTKPNAAYMTEPDTPQSIAQKLTTLVDALNARLSTAESTRSELEAAVNILNQKLGISPPTNSNKD